MKWTERFNEALDKKVAELQHAKQINVNSDVGHVYRRQ